MMDWLGEHAAEAWLAAMIVLAAGEMLSLDLVLGMLAAGAAVGLVAALVGLGGVAQVLLALVAATACLALVRPSLLRRLHSAPELKLGHHRLLGSPALVTSEISAHTMGRVKLAGEIWSAAAYDESLVIPVGATVEVLEIRGATAYVHPTELPTLPYAD